MGAMRGATKQWAQAINPSGQKGNKSVMLGEAAEL